MFITHRRIKNPNDIIPVKIDMSFNQNIFCFSHFTTFKMTRYLYQSLRLLIYLLSHMMYNIQYQCINFDSHVCYSCINMIVSKDIYIYEWYLSLFYQIHIFNFVIYIYIFFLLIFSNKEELYRSSMLLRIIKKNI